MYFGVDEYDDPLLTYYKCDKGNCTEIYDMKCTRTCDAKEFNFNFALPGSFGFFCRVMMHYFRSTTGLRLAVAGYSDR